MTLSVNEMLTNSRLIAYQFKTEQERKAIRLKFTVALIELILKEYKP
jgi:hypothetical protein